MENKIFLILVLIAILGIKHSFAQEKENLPLNLVKAGAGYFGEVLYFVSPLEQDDSSPVNPEINQIHNGPSLFFEYGYKMKNGYTFTSRLTMAEVRVPYNDPGKVYWDARYSEIYYVMEAAFHYDFQSENHVVSPGAGLFFRHIHLSENIYQGRTTVENTTWVASPKMVKTIYNDLGVSLNLDYYYNFKNSFFCGVHLAGNWIMAIGLETLAVSPFIGVRF